jgi:hypothetical protein
MENEMGFCKGKGLYFTMNWVASPAYTAVGVISDALFVFSILKNPDFASGGTKLAKNYVVNIVFFNKLQACSPYPAEDRYEEETCYYYLHCVCLVVRLHGLSTPQKQTGYRCAQGKRIQPDHGDCKEKP